MVKKSKKCYAVAYGACSPAPGIFSSWAETHALVTGVSGAKFKGFDNMEEAREYMRKEGISKYSESIDVVIPSKIYRDDKIYVVGNGYIPGAYQSYEWGAKKQLEKAPHACHKRLKSKVEAKLFCEKWRLTMGERAANEGCSLEDLFENLNISD